MERVLPDIEDEVNANVKLLNQKPVYNRILHSEVSLRLGEAIPTRKVTKHTIDPDITKSSTYNSSPYLNSMIYRVEFHNGQNK